MLRLKSLHERILAYVAYLKHGETSDPFDWFNPDVFPIKSDDDPSPMELYDSTRMSISFVNLKSTDKVNDYTTHLDLMLPLKPMEDLEAELEKVWQDKGLSDIFQDYRRSCTMMRNLGFG
eukprot:NODE_6_length_70510_cov_1.054395.p56 type:complete len:120 gc:universal NODE_6_length_70510_cov_1.054395:38270-38629(+)